MTEGKKSFLGDYKNRESGVYLKQKARSRRRIPILAEDEERELIRRWHDHQDISARDKLIQAHLRLVPRLARKAADKFGYRAPKDSPRLAWDGYENVCRELELAGNEGLLIASYRFDPYREARFATCAVWWIAKMCAEEAKRLRSVVTFPRRLAALWDTSLDEDEFCEDAAVDIEGVRPDLAEEASPLTSDLAEEEQAFFSGLATILDAKADRILDPRELHIFRARYLTENRTRLRDLANELDTNTARVHQLEKRALKKLRELRAAPQISAIEQLGKFYVEHSPERTFVRHSAKERWSYKIEDYLDVIGEMFPWATQADRIAAHRLADANRAEACDFNLNRCGRHSMRASASARSRMSYACQLRPSNISANSSSGGVIKSQGIRLPKPA